jgi:endonuclease/exonuclease/phosphatase family metal-dependent hydrolase
VQDDSHLRVLSLNVLHGFPRFEDLRPRLDRIADEIRRQEADLACLQEVPWTPRLGSAAVYLARQTGMNHVYLRANGNRWTILFEEGEAILSRYPLQDVTFQELRPRAALFEHRVVLRATAITPQGEVSLYCTHLTHGDPAVNQAQFAALKANVDQASAETSIVAGDLNATEDKLRDAAAGWRDSYRVARPDAQGYTCCVKDLAARSGDRLTKRIDYLYLATGAEDVHIVGSRRVFDQPFRHNEGWLWVSDHIGVMTTLSMQARDNHDGSGNERANP